jgi:hypothetical protein
VLPAEKAGGQICPADDGLTRLSFDARDLVFDRSFAL